MILLNQNVRSSNLRSLPIYPPMISCALGDCLLKSLIELEECAFVCGHQIALGRIACITPAGSMPMALAQD